MSLLIALLSASSFVPQEAASTRPIGDLGGAVWATLADKDRDGRSTRDEWNWLAGHLESLGSSPLLVHFESEFFLQGINQDGVTDWTDHDLEKTFDVLDANDDGVIERSELRGERLQGENPQLQLGYVRAIARLMLVETADVDEDGSVSAAERAALLAVWKESDQKVKTVREWVAASKAREPENRNAMTPGVTMYTIGADLDLNADGRVEPADLDAWFASRDTNGDGALTGDEIRMRRGVEDSWQRITDERRAMAPLMPWQRNLSDALAVQRRTGQPLLICVNMDGETACDSLAYWRYRDAGFADLARGFVCLVVSPDDHSPRDYDDRGRRTTSPRLGRVTDAEHIDLEPDLYERYFSGTRVAPRHVGVAPDGSILFDIYLTNDAGRIERALEQHGVRAPALDLGGQSLAELAAWPDAEAREAAEAAFLAAPAVDRISLLSSALATPDLAMLGLADESEGVRVAAVRALASRAESLTLEQFTRFARVGTSLDAETVVATIAAAERAAAGNSTFETKSIALALNGAFWPSRIGRTSAWVASAALSAPAGAIPDREASFTNLERVEAVLAASPGMAGGALLRATALFQLGEALIAAGQDPTDPFAEAAAAAATVEPAEEARGQAIIACVEHAMGQSDLSIRAAHRALPELVAAQSDPLVVRTLRALQDSCTRRVYEAVGKREPFLASDVGDAIFAGTTLLAHPNGTEKDATSLLTLLATTRDVLATGDVIDAALRRFPASPDLHGRFRSEILAAYGSAGMGAEYARLRRAVSDPAMGPTLDWYEGLARLVAAEWDVRQGEADAALAHYDASLESFARSVEAAPGFADSANHYRVLAQAGAASLEAQRGNASAAAERLVACAALRPDSLGQKDGLDTTPMQRAAALTATFDDEARAAVLAAFQAVSHPLD